MVPYAYSIIYQLLVIGTDDQMSAGYNLEHNLTNMFICTNILHDDYVIYFLGFKLDCFDCSYIP